MWCRPLPIARFYGPKSILSINSNWWLTHDRICRVYKKILKTNFPSILITVSLVLVIYALGKSVPQEEIVLLVKNAGVFAPLIFMILLLATYVFAPLSGSPVQFAGFILFQENTVIFSTIAAIVASATNFLLARRWGRKVVVKIIGDEETKGVDSFFSNYGLLSVFVSRVFLSLFHDVISYFCGLTKLKFWPYFLVSTLGMIPGNIIAFFVSKRIDSPLIFISSLTLIGYSLLAVAIIYKRSPHLKKVFRKFRRH